MRRWAATIPIDPGAVEMRVMNYPPILFELLWWLSKPNLNPERPVQYYVRLSTSSFLNSKS